MKKWGGYLFFFGVGSIVLDLVNMQFVILAWIDMWGPTVGWVIRIGLAAIGGGLWLMGRSRESAAAT